MNTPLALRLAAAAASAVTSAVLLTAMAWLPGAEPPATSATARASASAPTVVVARADASVAR